MAVSAPGSAPTDPLADVLLKLRLSRRLRRLADDVEAVLGLIPTVDGQPAIHRQELMDLTGLCRGRIAHVVKWVRHNIPEICDSLISGPSGYRRTLDEASVAAYRRHRLGHARTMIVTVRRVVEPVFRLMERTASDEHRRAMSMVRRNLDRVVEDLESLI